MLHPHARTAGLLLSLLALATFAPARAAQDDARPLTAKELVGEWVFFKDLSPPRAGGALRPNQGVRFVAKIADGVLELEQVRPGGETEHVHLPLDGSEHVVESDGKATISSGAFKEGVLHTDVRREPIEEGKAETFVWKYTYTRTAEGLAVRMQMLEPLQVENVSLYKRAEDMPPRVGVDAKLEQLGWLAGAWTGTMGNSSIEERWSPIAGGAMLAISRTVSGSRMVAFEYLRIVERDGGLVYVAQPNGRPPTEFVLTLVEEGRAVFENAQHDFPQRIEYARKGESGLRATISDLAGGRAQSFEFKREAK